MKKPKFYTELAYLFGIALLALGAAVMAKTDFGLSMVVAPAYVLHRAISPTLSFFTFGIAEYTLQAVLLLVLFVLIRRVRTPYLFSFVTAVIYGFLLDGMMFALHALVLDQFYVRVIAFGLGMLLCTTGVSLMFHTYIAPEVYELFVKVLSGEYHVPIHRFKTGYDCASCLVAIILSFVCFGFGQFVGVRGGTIVCALCNGTIIGFISRFLDRHFTFCDALSLRKFFEV